MDLLAPLLDNPTRACLLCDCDGTLAPIVPDPAAAAPLAESVAALHHLAGRLGLVGVVSGRPAAWLHDRFGDGLVLSGLYGLEEVAADGTGEVVELPEAEPWRQVVAEAADQAEGAAPAGVVVERKGLSVTLHYRNAPAEQAWVERFTAEQATRRRLLASVAKSSVELRPPLRVDKGTAVRRLAAGFATVAFIGDDAGDLPAFAVLDDLAAAGVRTLKLAVASSEMPEAVRAQADDLVEGPDEVARLISGLAAALA